MQLVTSKYASTKGQIHSHTFQYLFYSGVTAVAHKRFRSFSQKCRWQVTAKHTCTYACGFARSDMVHGCMVFTECAKMAADLCGKAMQL